MNYSIILWFWKYGSYSREFIVYYCIPETPWYSRVQYCTPERETDRQTSSLSRLGNPARRSCGVACCWNLDPAIDHHAACHMQSISYRRPLSCCMAILCHLHVVNNHTHTHTHTQTAKPHHTQSLFQFNNGYPYYCRSERSM